MVCVKCKSVCDTDVPQLLLLYPFRLTPFVCLPPYCAASASTVRSPRTVEDRHEHPSVHVLYPLVRQARPRSTVLSPKMLAPSSLLVLLVLGVAAGCLYTPDPRRSRSRSPHHHRALRPPATRWQPKMPAPASRLGSRSAAACSWRCWARRPYSSGTASAACRPHQWHSLNRKRSR